MQPDLGAGRRLFKLKGKITALLTACISDAVKNIRPQEIDITCFAFKKFVSDLHFGLTFRCVCVFKKQHDLFRAVRMWGVACKSCM